MKKQVQRMKMKSQANLNQLRKIFMRKVLASVNFNNFLNNYIVKLLN